MIITLKANTLTDVVFMTGMACCAMGIAVDLYTWGAQRLNRPLMKLVYSVLGIMATAMAAGGSAWTISEATGQDPSHFKTTIAFLTPLSFVPLFGLAVTLVGLIAVPALFLLAMGSLVIQDKSVTTWKLFAQMLGYLFVLKPSHRAATTMRWCIRWQHTLLSASTCIPIQVARRFRAIA